MRSAKLALTRYPAPGEEATTIEIDEFEGDAAFAHDSGINLHIQDSIEMPSPRPVYFSGQRSWRTASFLSNMDDAPESIY